MKNYEFFREIDIIRRKIWEITEIMDQGKNAQACFMLGNLYGECININEKIKKEMQDDNPNPT
jgi:hypothetical protein